MYATTSYLTPTGSEKGEQEEVKDNATTTTTTTTTCWKFNNSSRIIDIEDIENPFYEKKKKKRKKIIERSQPHVSKFPLATSCSLKWPETNTATQRRNTRVHWNTKCWNTWLKWTYAVNNIEINRILLNSFNHNFTPIYAHRTLSFIQMQVQKSFTFSFESYQTTKASQPGRRDRKRWTNVNRE